MNTETSQDSQLSDNIDEKGNYSGNPKKHPNQSEESTDEDESDEDFLPNNNAITSEASPYPPFSSQMDQNKVNRNAQSAAESPKSKTADTRRASSMSYDRKKPKNLFPPTKKYRYYPVTCEYCGKHFQPNKLRAHQRKRHFGESDQGHARHQTQSAAMRKGFAEPKDTDRSKSVGGIPRRLQICYICGRMYGSKSLKIHEPKCLDKWRIQNYQLPPNRRAPEPVKPEPLMPVSGSKGYSVPGFDPAAEAAYQSHLRTLIACSHCSRTFSPDRIMTHESCCIERPRTRKCITPAGGEIGRMKLLVFLCIIAVVNGMSTEDICSLDPDNGGCSSYTQKYFFNRYTGQCHEFVYGGCLGNKNQFETRGDCESFCEGMALDKKPDCMKKPEEGPCSGLIFRYYYDPDEMTCNYFTYGGCRGNANNFESVEECMDTCYESPETSR